MPQLIYHLWKNINEICLGDHLKTEDQLLQRINWDITARVHWF